MTDFPNGVNSPGAASYAAPLLDFSPLGHLADNYYKGQEQQQKQQSRVAFRNGIPKTPDGQNDYKAMTDKMIELGDYGTASTIGNLGYQQSSLEQIKTNPELNGAPGAPGAAPAVSSPPPAAASAPARRAATPVVAPADQADATPGNSSFTPPPGTTQQPNARVADGFSAAGQSALAPNVKAEIDRRLSNGDYETRMRNLGRLMMSPFPGVKEYAKLRAEALAKDHELTPSEKERGSGTTQFNTEVTTSGKNRELTPEQKNTGTGFGGNAAQAAEDIKVEGANRTDTPEQKNLRPVTGGKSAAQQTADITVDTKNRELTPGAKDTMPAPGESVTEKQERLKTRGAIDVDAGKLAVKNFDTDHVGLQKGSQVALTNIQKAELAKNLTLQPTFYSGPLHRTAQMFQQFRSTFGTDPNTAVPGEAFKKVTTDMLTEQIKSLGQSGVGRVLLAEVQNMQKGLASEDISPAGNRLQLEIVGRVSKHVAEMSAISREVNNMPVPPEQKAAVLQEKLDQYLRSHPLFTEQEKVDPRILSAPDVPASINTRPKLQAWSRSVGLSPGNLIKIDGQIGTVP